MAEDGGSGDGLGGGDDRTRSRRIRGQGGGMGRRTSSRMAARSGVQAGWLLRPRRTAMMRKGFGRSSSPWVDEESKEAQAQGLLFGCFGHEDEEAGTQGGARARERPGEDAA